MKKIIAFINKNDMLIMIAIILIAVVPSMFLVTLEPHDNLWNFGNIYKIYTGKLIYKDFNVLITPIFFLLGKSIFKLLGGNYFTFLLYGSMIMTILYILVYRVFRTLNIRKTFAISFTATIIWISYGFLTYGTNYNSLGLVFVLLGVLYSIKNAEKPSKYNCLIQSIFIMLTFLTLQKLGVRICYKLHFI